MNEQADRTQRRLLIVLLAVMTLGSFLRLPPALFEAGGPLRALAPLHPNPASTQVGFDEHLYRTYVAELSRDGLGGYPGIVDRYIEVQKTLTGSILPPMRFLYIFAGYTWHKVFGAEPLQALRNVASLFSILLLCLAALVAWRLHGLAFSTGVAALMAFAPTQLHMSQHALVDGFFAFWATLNLWLLWENLRAPRNVRWLVALVCSLALMVTTKENAAFVYLALVALLVVNRWVQWGAVTKELLVCMFVGPLLGVVVLVFLAGGFETLRTTYQLSVSKNYKLTYAIMTGDGPWHRYLVDLLLVSPVVLLLALGKLFRLNRGEKPELFVAVFVAASYLVMCNLKYGMNLRYANMWDMPLRVLALTQLTAITRPLGRHAALALGAAVTLICAIELRQYLILAVDYPLYELVSEGLLRALKILKSPGQP